MNEPEHKHRRRVRTGALIAASLAILVATAVIVFFVKLHRAQQEVNACVCNGRIYYLGYLLGAYYAKHETFPPAPGEPTGGKPPVSWRLLVWLNTLLATELRRYRLDEAWNSPANTALRDNDPYFKMVFSCPSDSAGKDTGKTPYMAIVGKGSVWAEVRAGRIRNPYTEAPNKILLVEVPHSDVYWTEPRDLTIEQAIALYRSENGFKGIRHPHGLYYLTAGGTYGSFDQIRNVEEFSRLLRAADEQTVRGVGRVAH